MSQLGATVWSGHSSYDTDAHGQRMARSMSLLGVARKIDSLGRIVLPAELRRRLGIGVGDYLDISVEDDSVVLRKVEHRCTFCGAPEDLIEHHEKLICKECVKALRAR